MTEARKILRGSVFKHYPADDRGHYSEGQVRVWLAKQQSGGYVMIAYGTKKKQWVITGNGYVGAPPHHTPLIIIDRNFARFLLTWFQKEE